ncbi:MAG: NADH-quinone oxidoreductase subunit NuoE [Chloroflexi bacterium]|nr:NADH-quinone oxidoreductase subunit NuoE [Chloroflexota bacterium]
MLSGFVVADELAKILASYRGNRSELLSILREVQDTFNYLPEEAMRQVAKFIGIPESQLYSVASFYSHFRLTPLGRKRISVCRGTACHIRGAPQVIEEAGRLLGVKESETTPDLEYTLETVACIGCCALAPCLRVNEEVHGEVTLKKVRELLPDLNNGA